MTVKCARCEADGADEFCWYCHARLCYACWDAEGQCGHPEADAIIAQGRARVGERMILGDGTGRATVGVGGSMLSAPVSPKPAEYPYSLPGVKISKALSEAIVARVTATGQSISDVVREALALLLLESPTR